MKNIDRTLAAVAVKQHSLITLDDVIAAGGSKHLAMSRVESGRWEQVYEGVYRIAGVPWTYAARVLAAIFAAGEGAVASYMCAVRLHGWGFPNAPVEISIPRGRAFHAKDVRVHTSKDLGKCKTVMRDGIPTTDPACTLLDLGRYVGPLALARNVEQARRLELVTWHDLIVCVASHARRGRHGIRRMRHVIGVGAANDEVTDTDSELMAVSLLREHGFEEPTLQHRIYDDDGILLTEMDIAYLDVMVNFEIDGDAHLQPDVRAKDDARDHLLRGLGWTVRRIWWEIPVRRPEEFLRIVRDTLRNATKRAPSPIL